MENIKQQLKGSADVTLDFKSISRFLVPSLVGVILFLCPIPAEGAFTTPIGMLSEWLAGVSAPFAPTFITSVIILSAIFSAVTTIFKPKWITENAMLANLFVTSPFYLSFRIIGAVLAYMILNELGGEIIYSIDTGGTMMSLVSTLVAWFFAASFLIPLLMDYGAMDYTGTLLRGFVQPLFKLPGRSAIDLVASWIGNCNVGVVLTGFQYENGYYTGREAIVIATCFSAVSLPFCLVIAAMLGLDAVFPQFYLTLMVAGIVSVVIMTRIWPLNSYSNEYYAAVGKQIDEEEPEGMSKREWALQLAVQKAASADGLGKTLYRGLNMFLGIIFSLSPLVMAWGTIALIVATYTPVFDWVSMPFGYYLQLLGLPEAFEAAPATIVGFADMFIPAILLTGISSVKTKFVVGVLSLVQIIYMTEVGTIMLTSKIPVKFKDLVIIFLQKTVIALPIIVLMANLLGIS